ncbi:MAG: hypothetical protein EB084_22075 [Proteobacteria bacterium]|nr:hypothetical protein [Pseudomonadota bacterium]
MRALFSMVTWELALNLSEMARLGRRGWYWRLHLAMTRAYTFDSAWRVVTREAPATGLSEMQLVYGETPAFTMLAMLARVGISPEDTLIDLGCGRGIAVMAAALEWPLSAVGIDALPTFVERGNVIARRLGIDDRVTLRHENFVDADLSQGTVFYAAATTFERDIIDTVAEKVARQASSAKRPLRFITLSQPLLPPWKMVEKLTLPMTWGRNTVYFHVLDASVADSSGRA